MADSVPSFVAIAHDLTRHPKLLALGPPAKRWVWLGLLCYAAEYRTGGRIPRQVDEFVKGAGPAFLERCLGVGLLEHGDPELGQDPGELYVHDWDEFNGTQRERTLARERQRRRRARAKSEGHGAVTLQRDILSGTRAQPTYPLPTPQTANSETAPRDHVRADAQRAAPELELHAAELDQGAGIPAAVLDVATGELVSRLELERRRRRQT